MIFSPKSIFLFFLLFLFLHLKAQNISTPRIDSINKLDSNSKKIKKFKTLLLQKDIKNHPNEISVIYYHLGLLYKKTKDFEKAILFLKKSTSLFKNQKQYYHLNRSRVYLAKCYEQTQNISLGVKIYKNIITENRGAKYVVYSYKRLASIAKQKGDFHSAFQYLNTLMSNKKLTKNSTDEITIRFKFIWIYAEMYESIIDTIENNKDLKIVKLHQKIIEEKINNTTFSKKIKEKKLNIMYNNLGIIYDAYKEYDNALKLYNKSYNYYLQKKDTIGFLSGAINIGLLNSKLKKHKVATKFYQKVINESSDKEQIAIAYDNMGYNLNKIFVDKRISYFQKAINTILSKQTKLKYPFILPTINEIKNASATQDIFAFLIDLANQYVYAFKEKKEKHYLYKGKETLYLIDELVSLIRYNSSNELSKLFWIKRGVNTYMLGVEICYLLNKPDEAFYFMEKNKALLLQEDIKNLQAKLALNIPKKIIEKEYSLHYRQIELNKKLQSNPNNKKIQTLYAKENKIYIAFMDSIKRQYPDYVKIKKEIKTVSLNQIVKKYTSKKKCFIEYILNEKNGYGLFCNKEEKILFKIENTNQLQNQLKQLKLSLTKPILTKNEIKAYHTIGYAVFKKLFAFDNAIKKITNKKLIVISDYTLQNFPFEALSTNLKKEPIQNYLVQNTEISYLQSFSVFEQIIQKKNIAKNKILGIAPTQFLIGNLPELTTSEKSIKKIKQYKSSKILTKERGTKSNFLKNSNKYEIIHLNTHAGLDSLTNEPWIAFRDKKLTLNEMFGIENNANLVILDACKTSDGDLAIGEGVINLSRGFFYNGTQSVLASLWNVNEKSSNNILDAFYKNIVIGKTKSKALQLAKTQYLKTHQSIELLPYYWATFILTGDTNTIVLRKNNTSLKLIIGCILLLLFSFIFYIKK